MQDWFLAALKTSRALYTTGNWKQTLYFIQLDKDKHFVPKIFAWIAVLAKIDVSGNALGIQFDSILQCSKFAYAHCQPEFHTSIHIRIKILSELSKRNSRIFIRCWDRVFNVVREFISSTASRSFFHFLQIIAECNHVCLRNGFIPKKSSQLVLYRLAR